MIGTGLTWTTATDTDGRLKHVANSRQHDAKKQYVVKGSLFFGATLVGDELLDVKYLGGRFASVVEAKQACQRHEDALAEGGE